MSQMADAQEEPAGRTISGYRLRARLLALQRDLDTRFPLWLKLALPLAVVVLVGSLLVMTLIYNSEAGRIRAGFESRAFLVGQEIEGAITAQSDTHADPAVDSHLQSHIDYLVGAETDILRIDVLQFGGDPRIVASSDHTRVGMPADDAPPEERRLAAGDRFVTGDADVNGHHALELFVPFRIGSGSPMTTAVYLSTAQRDAHLAALLRSFIIGTGITIVVAGLLLVISLRLLVLDRARMLLRATGRLEAGDFTVRIPNVPETPARDEMLELARRFNHTVVAIQGLHEQLATAATTDQLTGLYNRRHVMEALDREIARARREREPLAVIMADLDGLKQVNDRLGHVAGDAAICLAGQGITAALRAGDYAARFGGDEFVAVLPGCAHDDLRTVIERLQSTATDHVSAASRPGQPCATVSAGGTVLRSTDDTTSLLQRADDAMYEAKRAGKNQSRIAA